MNLLEKINQALENIPRPDVKDEIYPNIFIFGVPRSGTTLVSQVLIHCFDVGYVNNLTARFYRAPFVGAFISKELGIPREVSFESSVGRTPLISDPHEFGYFWSDVLGLSHENTHDICVTDFDPKKQKLDKMRREILALNFVFDKPCVFKNILTGLFVKEITAVLKKAIFIYTKRNIYDNAFSLLLSRKNLLGDERKWFSLKPREYKELEKLSPEEQVVAQVVFLRREFENRIKSSINVFEVEYEAFCKEPMKVINEIKDFTLKLTGCELKVTREVEPFEVKSYKEARERLKTFVEKYEGKS